MRISLREAFGYSIIYAQSKNPPPPPLRLLCPCFGVCVVCVLVAEGSSLLIRGSMYRIHFSLSPSEAAMRAVASNKGLVGLRL